VGGRPSRPARGLTHQRDALDLRNKRNGVPGRNRELLLGASRDPGEQGDGHRYRASPGACAGSRSSLISTTCGPARTLGNAGLLWWLGVPGLTSRASMAYPDRFPDRAPGAARSPGGRRSRPDSFKEYCGSCCANDAFQYACQPAPECASGRSARASAVHGSRRLPRGRPAREQGAKMISDQHYFAEFVADVDDRNRQLVHAAVRR